MAFEVPEDLRYLSTHEWARHLASSGEDSGGRVQIGITGFAQDELGDIVFVELPDIGEEVEQESAFGVIESIKAVSDLYSPISGEVVSRNDRLFDEPELVNEDPFGDGWMIEVAPTDEAAMDNLLTPEAYEEQIE